jgi:serine protease Do
MKEQPRGVGSGFILTADGLSLITLVVEGADLDVIVTNKQEFKAKIIGADKRTDVIMVKIEATITCQRRSESWGDVNR